MKFHLLKVSIKVVILCNNKKSSDKLYLLYHFDLLCPHALFELTLSASNCFVFVESEIEVMMIDLL